MWSRILISMLSIMALAQISHADGATTEAGVTGVPGMGASQIPVPNQQCWFAAPVKLHLASSGHATMINGVEIDSSGNVTEYLLTLNSEHNSTVPSGFSVSASKEATHGALSDYSDKPTADQITAAKANCHASTDPAQQVVDATKLGLQKLDVVSGRANLATGGNTAAPGNLADRGSKRDNAAGKFGPGATQPGKANQ